MHSPSGLPATISPNIWLVFDFVLHLLHMHTHLCYNEIKQNLPLKWTTPATAPALADNGHKVGKSKYENPFKYSCVIYEHFS